MTRKQKAYLLLAAILIPAAGRAQTARPLPRAESDRIYVKALSSRVSQHVARVIPRKTAGLPPEQKCSLIYPKAGKDPDFHITRHGSVCEIHLSRELAGWAFRPDTVLQFFNAMLSARAGSPVPLSEIWIAAGLVQEIYEPGVFYDAAGYGYHPCARVMLAHGIAPSVETVLESEPGDFLEGFHSAVRMDWCSILLALCTRRNDAVFLEKYLQAKGTPRIRKFEQTLFPDPGDHKKKIFSARNGKSADEWFRQEASKMILGRGIPASVPLIGERFPEIMEKPLLVAKELSAEWKKEKKDGKKEKLLPEEAVLVFTEAETELNRLALLSPEGPALKLFACAKALHAIRTGQIGDDPEAPLKDACAGVYAALSERAALESALKRAEQRLIPPGKRFALTLRAVAPKREDLPVLKHANLLLDRFEKD